MLKAKENEIILQNIKTGNYKVIRLCKEDGNTLPTVIIPFNRSTNSAAIDRYSYIVDKIKSGILEEGKYFVECKMTASGYGMIDKYYFVVAEKNVKILQPKNTENNNFQTAEVMHNENQISLEDYISLVKENAELKANFNVVEFEANFYKKEFYNLQQIKGINPVPLADNDSSTIVTLLKELGPSLLNLGERYVESLSASKTPNLKRVVSTSSRNVIERMPINSQKSLQEIGGEIAEKLSELTDEDFEREMNILENENTQLYKIVCDLLDVEEEAEGGHDVNE